MQIVVSCIIDAAWEANFDARMIQDATDAHYAHVEQKGRQGKREQKGRGVKDTVIAECLERMDVHVVVYAGCAIGVMKAVEMRVKEARVHGSMPIILCYNLEADANEEPTKHLHEPAASVCEAREAQVAHPTLAADTNLRRSRSKQSGH